MEATLRDVRPEDEADWRRLWAEFLAFNAQDLTDDITDATWSRIMDSGNGYRCLAAEIGGAVQGFAVWQTFQTSWHTGDVLYLEDFYVDAALRGQGIGRRMIETLKEHGRDAGLSCMIWQAEEDNTRARKLYDELTGGPSSRVTYELEL